MKQKKQKKSTQALFLGARATGLIAGVSLVEGHPILGVTSLVMTAALVLAAAVTEEGLFLDEEPKKEDETYKNN